MNDRVPASALSDAAAVAVSGHTLPSRTGAQLLVDALRVHGVDTAFCVPGESYLAVIDAMYE